MARKLKSAQGPVEVEYREQNLCQASIMHQALLFCYLPTRRPWQEA